MAQVSSRLELRLNAGHRLPFVAADVGGTYARLGLVTRIAREAPHVMPDPFRTYRCADYPSLTAIFRDFLHALPGLVVRHGAIASAGYTLGSAAIHTNLPWPVAIEDMRSELGFEELSLINDFAAVAHATQYLDGHDMTTVSRVSTPVVRGPIVVLGPGTGLGAAVLVPGEGAAIVLATEAGQAAFAPTTSLEIELLGLLRERFGHVSIERVLSGPGLMNLYAGLSVLRDRGMRHHTPEEVTAAALGEGDAVAREALETFCGLMGSVAGDLALLYGAHGGVYLAGGIVPQIRDFLLASDFLERFVDKGALGPLLERVPVKLIEHGQLGVIGAASWYLENHPGQ